MKILMLNTFYPEPGRKDLVQDTSAMHYIAREWARQGHEVTVLHCYGHYFKELFREFGKHRYTRYGKVQERPELDGVKVLLIENQHWNRGERWFPAFQQKQIASAINRYFAKHMPDYAPDIMLVHFPTQLLGIPERLNFHCKKSAVMHITDVETLTLCPQIRGSFGCYSHLGARTFRLQKELLALGMPVDFVAHSGIDGSLMLTDEQFHAKWDTQSPEVCNLVYAGSMMARKNVDTIVRAVAALKDEANYHLTIVGDGECRALCESLVQEAGIEDRVTFTGRVSREETIRHMQDARYFIMVSRHETLGLVYLEAMTKGCISIGSRNEGIEGVMVDGENGYLVDAGNADQLTELLRRLWHTPLQEQRRLAYAGLVTVREMTSEKTAANYLADARK